MEIMAARIVLSPDCSKDDVDSAARELVALAKEAGATKSIRFESPSHLEVWHVSHEGFESRFIRFYDLESGKLKVTGEIAWEATHPQAGSVAPAPAPRS